MVEVSRPSLLGPSQRSCLPFQMGLRSSWEWLLTEKLNSSIKLGILSFLVVSVSIAQYLILFSVPRKLRIHLKMIYPEYELV